MSTLTAASPRAVTNVSRGGWLLALAALVALGITTWRYFTPLSGITGTLGALLAMFGELALVVAGIALARLARGTARTTFLVLSWIGIVLTALAVFLLHGWFTLAALAVAIVGLAIETSTSPRRLP